MAQTGIWENLHLLVRWLHVLAGITWIGHLYFFNFVNGPFQGKIDAATKKIVNPQLMPRALFWFRWGAMITLLAGLYLFSEVYMRQGLFWNGPADHSGGISERSMWIMLGMGCGIVMWFNVWFIIWPAQKIIQAAVRDGTPGNPALVKRATLASKINTYLSGPMLFGMLAPSHYGSFNVLTGVVAIAVALAVIWHLYKVSPKTGAAFATQGPAGSEKKSA
jgi:uncharacterized membrane protein